MYSEDTTLRKRMISELLILPSCVLSTLHPGISEAYPQVCQYEYRQQMHDEPGLQMASLICLLFHDIFPNQIWAALFPCFRNPCAKYA